MNDECPDSGIRTFIIHRSSLIILKGQDHVKLHNESPKESFSGRHAQDRHPADDRRPARRRARGAGRSDDGHGPIGGQAALVYPAPRQRPAGRMRDRRRHDRPRGRNRRLRREVPQGRRGPDDHRHPVLVLWRRDDGHGSVHAQGGLGLQRHRTARRGLSGSGAGRTHAKGPAGLQHLRPRRSGRQR